jgi:hypothetical protein
LLEGGILGVRPNLRALSGECGRFHIGEHRVLQSIMHLPRRKHWLSTRVVAREAAKDFLTTEDTEAGKARREARGDRVGGRRSVCADY